MRFENVWMVGELREPPSHGRTLGATDIGWIRWPDFGNAEVEGAILHFAPRNRGIRFGGRGIEGSLTCFGSQCRYTAGVLSIWE